MMPLCKHYPNQFRYKHDAGYTSALQTSSTGSQAEQDLQEIKDCTHTHTRTHTHLKVSFQYVFHSHREDCTHELIFIWTPHMNQSSTGRPFHRRSECDRHHSQPGNVFLPGIQKLLPTGALWQASGDSNTPAKAKGQIVTWCFMPSQSVQLYQCEAKCRT